MKAFLFLLALMYSQISLAGTGRIVNSGIADNAGIVYSKMQSIPSHNFLGNNSGVTGPAAAMTPAQATALISTLVGDSGSGGSAGLCPAPGAGDAASGKYLKADGTWATVSSSQWTTSGSNIYYSPGNVGVGGAPGVGAALDVFSTTGGIGFPNFTTAQRNAITPARSGLVIYNNDNGRLEEYVNGFWTAVASNPSTTDDLTEGSTNKYYTDARSRSAISGTAPISYNSSTGVISCIAATGSVAGCLSAADYTTFNAKLASALTNGHIFVGSAGGAATDVALSGDCTISNTGAITCTKTSGSVFVASATTDTTNATNIGSGTLADARLSGNVPLLNAANVFTANESNSYAGTASTAAMKYSGAPYAAGSSTTNKPQFWMEWGAPTSTNWSAAGTAIGVNSAAAYTGKLLDLQANGVEVLSVDYGNNTNSNRPGISLYNPQDNANAVNIVGHGATVGASANVSSLYQGNPVFTWYSLDASGGSFGIWEAQMAWATMVIGNSAQAQAFSSSTQPELLVANQNWASANTSPTLGIMPKTSQTAPILQTYQPYSTSTAPFSVTAAGYPAITPQAAASTPTCGVSQNGALALTSTYILCVCNTSAWVKTADGSTSCTF